MKHTVIDQKFAVPLAVPRHGPFGNFAASEIGRETSEKSARTDDYDKSIVFFIRAVLISRRSRSQLLPDELFAEPAWDMLLDLAAATLEKKQISVSSLCLAAVVPPPTGLRWIKNLVDAGLIERCPDPNDKRRVYLILAPHALDAMIKWTDRSRLLLCRHMRAV